MCYYLKKRFSTRLNFLMTKSNNMKSMPRLEQRKNRIIEYRITIENLLYEKRMAISGSFVFFVVLSY
jgi:hypothetical protein